MPTTTTLWCCTFRHRTPTPSPSATATNSPSSHSPPLPPSRPSLSHPQSTPTHAAPPTTTAGYSHPSLRPPGPSSSSTTTSSSSSSSTTSHLIRHILSPPTTTTSTNPHPTIPSPHHPRPSLTSKLRTRLSNSTIGSYSSRQPNPNPNPTPQPQKIRRESRRRNGTGSHNNNSSSASSESALQRRKELKAALHRRVQEEILRDEGGYDEDAEEIRGEVEVEVEGAGRPGSSFWAEHDVRRPGSGAGSVRKSLERVRGSVKSRSRRVGSELGRAFGSLGSRGSKGKGKEVGRGGDEGRSGELGQILTPEEDKRGGTGAARAVAEVGGRSGRLCLSLEEQQQGAEGEEMESDAAFAKSTGKAQGKLQKSNPSLQRSGTVLHVASKTGTGPRTRTRAEADVVHRSGTVLKWRGKVDHDGKSGSGAEVDPTRERTAQTPKSAEQRKKFVEKGGKAQEGRDVTSLTGEHKNSVANPQGQQAEKEQPRNRPHLRLKTSPADLEPDARDGEEENDSLQWGVDNVPPLFSSSSEMPALQHPSPRSLLAVKSLPQLEGFARRRQGGRSSDTTSFSMMSLDFCMSHGHGRCSNSDESGQFASGDVPEAWGSVLKKKEEDAAGCSSVYPSESGSLLESPSSSILRVATLQDVLRNSEENLVSLWEGKKNVVGRRSAGKEDVMRRKSEEKEDVVEWSGEKNEELRIDATKGRREGKKMMSPLSSTDSFIKKELAAVEARIARVAKASTTSSNSKFTEELGSTSSGLERNNTVRAHKRPPRKYSPENGDGSNDWQQSDTQRPGFRHSHVSHEDQDTAGLWEKALQTHRETKADSKSRRSSFSASVGHRSGLENKPKKPILPRLRTSNLFPTNQVTPPKIDPSPTPGGSERHTTGTPEKKRIGTPPSWARYPSHTRDSRTSSAGEDDNVVVRDFVPRAKYPFSKINNQNPNYTFSSQLSKNKKSRSMTFGRNLFKSWSRLYKTQSTDFRRVGKGFRSSVSVGGHVEYPELELIGGGDLPFPHMSKAEEEELPRFIRFSREQARVAAANGATSMSSAGSGESESGMSSGLDRSAKVWSKLYEDCVTLPNSDEHVNELGESSMAMGKIVPTSSSFLGERDALKRSRTRLSRANSSTSGRGLRVSTVDFEKGLREYEERARMETLRVADEAWGR